MLQRGIPTSNPLTYSRLVAILCAERLNISLIVQKIDGVTSVSVNFLGQKMVLEAPDDRFDTILNEAKALIKKIEPDVTVKA